MPDPWFNIPTISAPGERITLDQRESRHASGARRLREGEHISVFDGRGCVAGATIIRTSGKSIEIELGKSHIEPPFVPDIHLAAALPKGDRQSVMLNMATQLGIASFTPIICEHGIVKPGSGFAERAERICIEACKQSRNARLPVIHEPHTISDVLRERGGNGSSIILAHACGNPIGSTVGEFSAIVAATIMIGPEGGFTTSEVNEAHEAGAIMVNLGRTVLRTETAAVAMVSFLRLTSIGR